ncbi:MAG: hypothetical protein AB7G23_02110 [Vicinamibacterales bacterium]|nr:hypothetical protein [Acidobacteriota bacterium]
MSYCEHCQGQRFDRAQVLRALREIRHDMRQRRAGREVDDAVKVIMHAVRALEIPHLDPVEDDDPIVH